MAQVVEVALAVGFSERTHFSRIFHREVGMAANAYRRA
jgi:transcriptional regulator GlxA family with amidase domain